MAESQEQSTVDHVEDITVNPDTVVVSNISHVPVEEESGTETISNELPRIRPTDKTDIARKVTVLGGGSFGTAIAAVLARKNHKVTLYVRREDQATHINKEHKNDRYLTQYALPPSLVATSSLKSALEGCEYIIHAIPTQHSYSFYETNKDLIPDNVPIISLSKGLHIESRLLMFDVIREALGRPKQRIAVLSGPSFAAEILQGQPTAVVCASPHSKTAAEVQRLFLSTSFRVYTSTDVVGVEIAGALKNIIAIASGICIGMNLGLNPRAALITRGMFEIIKLSSKMGAKQETLAGLAGVGDLMLTCYGGLSRNLRVGKLLGLGKSLKEIMVEMNEVAEGVFTAQVIPEVVKKYGFEDPLELPILFVVHDIVMGTISPQDAAKKLMSLPVGFEYRIK